MPTPEGIISWRDIVMTRHTISYRMEHSKWMTAVDALIEIGKTDDEIKAAIMSLPEQSRPWQLTALFQHKPARDNGAGERLNMVKKIMEGK